MPVSRLFPASLWILLFAVTLGVCGEPTVDFFNVDISGWPTLGAQFVAFDSAHQPLRDLAPKDFIITENGVEVVVTRVSCPPPLEVKNSSVVLSFDLSGSMGGVVDSNGVMSIDLAQSSATRLIDRLTPTTFVALQSCTDFATLEHDFTPDHSLIRARVNALQPVGGNDFIEQLLNPITGALNIAKTGVGKRAVVLFTDAWWKALPAAELQRCLDTCAKYHIQLYALVFTGGSASPNGIKSSLATLCNATGGGFYDGVITAGQATTIAQGIATQLSGEAACTIEWQHADLCLVKRVVRMGLRTANSSSNELTYLAPHNSLIRVAASTALIDMGPVFPTPWREQSYTITATNHAVTIRALHIDDTRFAISGITLPKILARDSSITLTVRFTPFDSTYAFGTILMESDACINDTVYCSGGVPGAKPIARSLRLVYPNGGEMFTVNDSIEFVWTGVPPTDPVRLEFSGDNGATWNLVTDSATGWRYSWKLPSTPSDVCLARATLHLLEDDSVPRLLSAPPQLGSRTTSVWGNPWAFSPTDSAILVVGYDSCFLVDGFDGHRLRTLCANTGGVFQRGAFSIDGSYVLAGNPVSAWTVATGARRYSLETAATADINPNGFVLLDGRRLFNDVPTWPTRHSSGGYKFTPDGTFLYDLSSGGTLQLWSIATGGLVGSAHLNTTGIISECMNADHSLILTTRGDSTAIAWSVANGAFQLGVKLPGATITSAQYSPDGKYILTNGPNGTQKLWTAISGLLVRSFGGPGLRMTQPQFSADTKKIVAITNDTSIGVWNVATGLLENIYITNGMIGLAIINGIGTRVAFNNGSGDYLWKLDTHPLQQDTSDAVWRIVAPQLSTNDVDFGVALMGEVRDTVARFISNLGLAPATITGMTITGANAGEFSFTSGESPSELAPGEARVAELHFAPIATGARVATLRIIAGDTVFVKLRGVGTRPVVQVVAGIVDFGTVSIDSVRSLTVDAVVKNIGTATLTFSSAVQHGPDMTHFGIDSGNAPFTLAPKESRSFKMHFAPTAAGRASGSVLLTFDGPGSPAVVPLFGTGAPHGPVATVPSSLAFAPASCRNPRITDSVTIRNDGGSMLVIKSATIIGTDSASFGWIASLPDSLTAGDSRAYPILFTPQHGAAHAATVTVLTNGIDSISTIALTGVRDSSSFALSSTFFSRGLLCPSDAWDTTLMVFNTGTTPLNVHTVANGMAHTSPVDAVILVGDSVPYTIHVDGVTMDSTATITINETECGTAKTLTVRTSVSIPRISVSDVSMIGPLGGFVDTTVTVWNPSTRAVTLDSVTFSSAQFSNPTAFIPFTIGAGQSRAVGVRYQPADEFPSSCAMTVWGSPCMVSGSATLRGVPTVASSVVKLSDAEARVGTNAIFKLTLEASRDLDSVGARHFVATVLLPRTLLLPRDSDVVIASQGTETRITFSGRRTDTTGLLRTFTCLTLVGDTTLAPVRIESFVWTDGTALVNTIDGSIHVLNICPDEGELHIRYMGTVAVSAIVPNPATGEMSISYRVAETGPTRLEITDVLGRRVGTIVDRIDAGGEHTVRWNASGLAPGVYACSLATPSGVARGTLVISR